MQELIVQTAQGPLLPMLAPMPSQADSDEQLIELWLFARGEHTRQAYTADVCRFRRFVDKPLQSVTLGDLQAFVNQLHGLADSSRARISASIKSLLSFAHKVGYVRFNVGAALTLPKRRNRLSERILTEAQVIAMFTLEPNLRNRAILRTLYIAGLRVSELVGLCWRDLQERGETEGQLTVFGKGGKTRAVLLPAILWQELLALRGEAGDDLPVFRSRKGGTCLDRSQVMRLVRQAADRAGIKGNVSPHWLRHCHASHALDRGCPAHLLQQTLGHSSLSTTGMYAHARPSESSSKYLAV